MPLYFWGDTDNQRYLSSYFDMYPNVWRHGDWLKIGANGGCVIYGRSDATINRHGLRMGTSELYSAVEALPEVLDSLVVDLEYLGRDSYMPLFVVLRDGVALDDGLRGRINQAIRTALSPRFVPDAILQVQEVPRTLVRQEAGVADQEAAAGPAAGQGGEPGGDGQSRLPGLVCGVCAHAPAAQAGVGPWPVQAPRSRAPGLICRSGAG